MLEATKYKPELMPLSSAASGMEARQGQDAEERLDAKHDSPTVEDGDAKPQGDGGSNVSRY